MVIRTLLLATLLLAQQRAAIAQDRPLLEPFRVGYPQGEPIAERMRAAGVLDRTLRRKGFVVVWHEYDRGLAAVRALHAEEIDLALNASLSDVVTAKRENLKMIFVAELRSIAPSCCDFEELFADHIFKRYTLASEYFADRREDILLIVHQEMTRTLQRGPEHLASEVRNLVPIPVASVGGLTLPMSQQLPPGYRLDDVGRSVLAGLTFEETEEFNALDTQLPFKGEHVWPTEGLPRLPVEERWHTLWTRHQAALAAEHRARLNARRL